MTEKFLTTRVRPAFAALLLFLMTGLCAADGVFKWYLHTDKVNETKAAIAAALDNNRPLLIFVGKPGCANCELVWSGPKYLLGETKMADFLEQERIVGLKIEDTTGHFTNLCDAKNYYTDIYGVSGKKVNSTAPLFFFFKVKSSARGKSKITLGYDGKTVDEAKTEVELFLGAYGNAKSSEKSYAKVTSWLNGIMGTNAFKAAFPAENAPELEATLEFLESDPAFLGTTANGTKYATANGVAKTATAFTAAKRTLYFKFNAVKGRRYTFSTAANIACTAKITASVHPLNTDQSPKAAILTKTTDGFGVLADGFFFEPTATADYYLRLTADSTLTAETRFSLNHHWTANAAVAGTLGMPLWKGVQNGKWSMDYDAAVASKKPFLLYFVALTWCPHCCSLEHLVLDNDAFKSATANIPMVVLDNRRRGEATGPTLLYAASYRSYVISQDANITTANIDDAVAAKLATNHQIQLDLAPPGANASKPIPYPSILLCQGQDDGSVKVLGRTPDATRKEFPVGTDFDAYSATFATSLIALKDDAGEAAADDYASTTTAALDFDNTEPTAFDALVGCHDTTDWRTVNFNMGLKQTFTIQSDALAPTATVSLGLYDTSGTEEKDGELQISASGTGANPPVLEFAADAGTSWRLKIAVANQPTAAAYTLVCTPDKKNRPYEAGFEDDVYNVRQADAAAGVKLGVAWKRTLATSESATVRVSLDGQGTVMQPNYSIGFTTTGRFEVPVTGLQAAGETTVTLIPVTANCEVKEESATAVIRVVGAPVFTEFDDGATHELALCQNMKMEDKVLSVLNGLTEATSYDVQGTLPQGIDLEYQPADAPGGGAIVVSGTPLKATTVPQVVTLRLKTDGGAPGATLKLSFTVRPLSEVNPTAGTVAAYTGYLANKNNKSLKGLFTLTRDAESGQLEINLKTPENPDGDTSQSIWDLDSEGTAEARFFGDTEQPLVLSLSADGTGTGTFGDLAVSFAPNMTADEAAEYAGQYNISLESNHEVFQGYGGIVMTVGNDGGVTFEALMPNDVSLPDGAGHLVLENGQGVLSLLECAEDNTLAGRLAIVPKSERSVDEPQPCISGCEVPLAWLQDGEKVASLSPCGTEYDTARSFTSQLKGHDGAAFGNVAFYAVWNSCDVVPEELPAGVLPQLLPAGLVVTETDHAFTYANDDVFAGLELTLGHGPDGWWDGSLYGFTQEGRNENAWTFRGVLTPIPASCCGAGPDAVGYGALFVKDGEDQVVSSWPVRLIPDAALPNDYRPATPAAAVAGGAVAVSGIPEGQEDAYAYAYLGYAGDFLGTEWTEEACAVALAGYGRVGMAIDLPAIVEGGFAIPLTEEDRFKEGAPDNAAKWRCFATPADILPKGDTTLPEDLLVYTYPDGADAPVRVTDWATLKPGQAFFVYLTKAGIGTAAYLVQLDGFETTPEATPAGQFLFRGYEEGAAEFWKWANDRYVGPNATDGAGWLKK